VRADTRAARSDLPQSIRDRRVQRRPLLVADTGIDAADNAAGQGYESPGLGFGPSADRDIEDARSRREQKKRGSALATFDEL
jgi:hypothetical protein